LCLLLKKKHEKHIYNINIFFIIFKINLEFHQGISIRKTKVIIISWNFIADKFFIFLENI
jgi:hypothetical protein